MPEVDPDFRLAEWVVVPNRLILVASSDERRLEPKAMETLLYLARRPGETVTRDELIEQVWKDTYGTDEVLSRIISVLRSQLGDDSRNPRFIETIPKIGYRLLVAPQPVAVDTGQGGRPAINRLWVPVALAVIVLIGLVAWFFLADTAMEDSGTHTIAVVPFRDLSPEGSQEFFAVGLTDELITRLGRYPELRIVSRRSLESDPANIDFFIDGNVMLADNKIRVFSELSSGPEGLSLWSESYESDAANYLDLQQGISDLIVRTLDRRLGLKPLTQSSEDIDISAYTAYLQGNFLSKLRSEGALEAGIGAYRRALEQQPDFDRARLGIARALALSPYYSDTREEDAFARAQSELAALTSGDSAEADAIRAFIAFRQWRWRDADALFRQSIEQEPRLADTYVWYSQFLSAVGRNDEALQMARLAFELDAVSPVVNDRLATAYLWTNQNELALARYRAGANLGFANPVNAGYLTLMLRKREFDKAGPILGRLHAEPPEPLISNLHRLYDPGFRPRFVTIATELIEEGRLAPRLELGLWILLGEFDRALDTVEKYRGEKKYIDVEYLFAAESAALRQQPVFEEIVRVLGLDTYWDLAGRPDFR